MPVQLLALSNLPNLHPAIIHFPIVLLVLAIPIEALSIWRGGDRALRRLAVTLVVLGWLSLGGAYLSGRAAANGLGELNMAAEVAVAGHSDAALRTLGIFLVVLVGRLIAIPLARRVDARTLTVLRLLLLSVGIAGLWFLVETSDRGGGLVYQHALAVNPDGLRQPIATSPAPTEDEAARPSTVATTTPDPSGRYFLMAEPEAAIPHDAVFVSGSTLLLLLPGERDDTMLQVEMDLTGFMGSASLVHHFHSLEERESLRLDQTGIALLRHDASGRREFDRATMGASDGLVRVVVSAVGSHLKGIVNGELKVHGHRPAPAEPGRVGLLFEGRGLVAIETLTVSEPP